MSHLLVAAGITTGVVLVNGLTMVAAEHAWFSCTALLTHWVATKYIFKRIEP